MTRLSVHYALFSVSHYVKALVQGQLMLKTLSGEAGNESPNGSGDNFKTFLGITRFFRFCNLLRVPSSEDEIVNHILLKND